MSTILRASDHQQETTGVAFNFDDMAGQAQKYLDKVRVEAVKIIAQAQQEAANVRKQAEVDGKRAAMATTEQLVKKELGSVLPALHKAIQDIQQAKQAWLTHWEATGVHVAAAIARRLIRRELSRQPDIPIALVRESLQLAAGSPQVRIHLHPADHKALGNQVQALIQEMSGFGDAEIIADASISAGGCRVDTRFGTIDQQFEAQLARVEEELAP